MQGTLSIVKRPDTVAYRIRFYRTEIPDGLSRGAFVARGIPSLEGFLDAIGMQSERQRAIKDALKTESFANILEYRVPDEVLKRYGLM